MSSKLFVFGEGTTESIVFEKLNANLKLQVQNGKLIIAGGKREFNPKIVTTVKSEITNKKLIGRYISMVAFRDLDKGETVDRCLQSFDDNVVWKLIQTEANFQLCAAATNVYISDIAPTDQRPGLRFVVHLADKPPLMPPEIPILLNQTTDEYILAVALLDKVLASFAEDINIPTKVVNKKVISEIPQLFQDNEIVFNEGKDFLAAYQLTTKLWRPKASDRTLISAVLRSALKNDPDQFWQIFASWRIALEEAISA